MITRHTVRWNGRCPVDDQIDEYVIVVTTQVMIKVERILEVLRSVQLPVFQEELTLRLASDLQCRVQTFCVHSGVETECDAG